MERKYITDETHLDLIKISRAGFIGNVGHENAVRMMPKFRKELGEEYDIKYNLGENSITYQRKK